MGAGKAADKLEDRRSDRREQGPGQVCREFNVEGIAVAGCILNSDVPSLAGNLDGDDAAGGDQRIERFKNVGRDDTLSDFVAGKIAQAKQQIVEAIGVPRTLVFAQKLELRFDFRNSDRIEQLAQVCFPEQVGKLGLIDRERSGAAFGQRSIPVVDEVSDVSEEQRRRKGRGFLRVDDVDVNLAIFDRTQNIDQRGHVEGVTQALPVGFEQHGERRVARGDRKQICRSFALLPEWGADLRAASREQQGARRGFAKFRGEERGRAKLMDHQILRDGRIGEQKGGVGRLVDIGEAQNEAVVGGHGFDVRATGGENLRGGGHGPRACGCGCRMESGRRRASRPNRRECAQ